MIKNITQRVLYLENGNVKYLGNTAEGITLYKSSFTKNHFESEQFHNFSKGIRFESVEPKIDSNRKFLLDIVLSQSQRNSGLKLVFNIGNYLGLIVCRSEQAMQDGQTRRQKFSFKTDKLLLAPGHYTIDVAVRPVIGSDLDLFAWWRSAAAFEVTGPPASTIYVQSFLASNVTV